MGGVNHVVCVCVCVSSTWTLRYDEERELPFHPSKTRDSIWFTNYGQNFILQQETIQNIHHNDAKITSNQKRSKRFENSDWPEGVTLTKPKS
ncbi:hypothetical protein LDENG_00226050, partial [Lucifuga dentata]